jgi:transcription elongation GreA/GreB family factor
MSRAFVKEPDGGGDIEDLPDRPVSPHPNLVTERGLKLIEAELEGLRSRYAEAQRKQDRSAVAQVSRDLRYWTRRRAGAQVIEPPHRPDKAAFATRVTIRREDGREQRFVIVGEDEADPAQGFIAYVAPMARALLGRKVGDLVEAPGGEVEIVAVSAE